MADIVRVEECEVCPLYGIDSNERGVCGHPRAPKRLRTLSTSLPRRCPLRAATLVVTTVEVRRG